MGVKGKAREKRGAGGFSVQKGNGNIRDQQNKRVRES